jgi:hypothetical protein
MIMPMAVPPWTVHLPGPIEPPHTYAGVEGGLFEDCACEVCGTCPSAVRVWLGTWPGGADGTATASVAESHYFCELHRLAAESLLWGVAAPCGTEVWR